MKKRPPNKTNLSKQSPLDRSALARIGAVARWQTPRWIEVRARRAEQQKCARDTLEAARHAAREKRIARCAERCEKLEQKLLKARIRLGEAIGI